MYNSATTSQENSYSTEAKYTVADILSSMANGEGFADPSYSNGVTSVTTPTSVMTPTSLLTPSTLTSLEQTFMDLQQANENQNASRQSGFVPPVVDPRLIKQEQSEEYYSEDSCDPEWTPPSKRSKMDDPYNSSPNASPAQRPGPRRHTGPRPPRKHEVLTPEEEERRKVRRERNKQAAAKCRQRRVDHTNELIQQTEDLEDQKSSLEGEIKALQQQKEQLEFLLDAHRPLCESRKSGMVIKAEPKDSETTDMACQTIAATRPRPTTLPLSTTACTTASVSSVTLATGIAINTPSNGVFATLGLDSMVDGHTGLTPITGAPTSCANEMQRNVDSESSSSSTSQSLSSPTTLIAL